MMIWMNFRWIVRVYLVIPFFMKTMIWNVHGTVRSLFKSSVKTLVADNQVDICVILELHISGTKSVKTANRWGFSKVHTEEGSRFSGGI